MRGAIVLIGVVGFLLAGCSTSDDTRWKRLENQSFSFSVPRSFKKTDARGIDSFVEEYTGDGILLSFDYGIYSNNFGDWPEDTKYEDLEINGKAARIGTLAHASRHGYAYTTQIRIEVNGILALSMHARCRSEREVNLAKQIFQTIKFASKNSPLSGASFR